MYKQTFSFLKNIKNLILAVFIIFLISFAAGVIYPSIALGYQEKIIKEIITGAEGQRLFGVISYIIFTNLKASALGVFTGALFCVIPLGLLVANGYLIGAVTSRTLEFENGIRNFMFSLLPHGIFEIPAAVLSYSLGIWIGIVMIKNIRAKLKLRDIAKKTWESYITAFKAYIFVVVPLLLIAGCIEGILFKYYMPLSAFFFQEGIYQLIYSLVLLYIFYLALKLMIVYKREWDRKYLVMLSFIFLVATYMWMKAYGLRVEQFLASFIQIIIFIPLGLFLLYSYFEDKRRKEEAAKMQMKSAFRQYVAPEIIEEILKDPEKLKLGGEKKELSIFFSDIRGFTTISEKLKPEELVHFLNEYLSEMSEIIMKNKGVIDKYIGDAIMAFWGAPIEEKDHARLACESCIEMKEKLKTLNQKLAARGLPHIKIGMGVNTGEAVVGNLGSKDKFDYTIIGDNVNLASRLEGLNKMYETAIIINETTYEKVKSLFLVREIDLVKVKGKTKPVRIYELLDKKRALKPHEKEFLECFQEAVGEYQKGKIASAEKLFKKAEALNKTDAITEMYLKRCSELKKQKLPANWDGVFEHHEK